ncbi:hypothetical protein AAC387_Pa09g1467 [Persea americana]
MEKPKENLANGFGEIDIGSSADSFYRFLDSQKELFHSQVDQLQQIVVTQCRLTGVNPLAQEMAAGALSIKIGKRPRDLLNPKAVKYMQSVFSIKDTIGKKETREISALCGVTVTQVREFFAGQRSRVRRLVRLSREKAIRFNSCKEFPDGCPTNSDDAILLNNPVPLNSLDPKDVEGPSCSSQEESVPGIDSSDKNFLENIFNLMRKEETFSGQEKLMEWVLQIHNSAVLQSFIIKGGIMILATWLSQAAVEEQTTVLLVILKVLCHLPLHKALPVQMSAILQSVNRLRFYRTSDISNRARVLLSRWSKLFVRSQTLKKQSSKNSPSDLQKERIRKQRISEILSDESWQSKIDIPEEILALAHESPESSRKSEPTKALKLLTASSDDSSKKHVRGTAAAQTRERRKVLLVEQPGSRTSGRSVQVARVSPLSQGRPMSADDIQKAKMRAIFMQSKYGKIDSSSNDNSQQKSEGQKTSGESLTRNTLPASNVSHLKKEDVKKPAALPSKTPQTMPENSMDSKPRMAAQEPLWQKLKIDQIQWQAPPEIRINCLWGVGAGERSKEVEVQTGRIRREKEIIYRNLLDIPSNPKDPWDVEMGFDDTLTPEIPTEQPPEADGAEVSTPRNCEKPTEVSSSRNSDTPAEVGKPAPSAVGSGSTEPDLELLAVLLKNPELVFALTSGQGNSIPSVETVALLDTLKASGVRLPGILGGLGGNAVKVVEKQEATSLPSPTPPNERGMNWRSEPAPMYGVPEMLSFPQPVTQPGNRGGSGLSTPSATAIPSPEKVLSNGLIPHQIPTTKSSVLHPQVAITSPQQQRPLISPQSIKPLPVSVAVSHPHPTPSSTPISQTRVAPSVQKLPSNRIPPLQVPVTASSLQQNPLPEAVLRTNHFQGTNSSVNLNNLPTGSQSQSQQIPRIRVEISNSGQLSIQKLPPTTILPNPTANISITTPSRPPMLQTPMRSQRPLLPEHQGVLPQNLSWSHNKHASVSIPSTSSNNRLNGSSDQSFNYTHPASRNNFDTFQAGSGQPRLLHGRAMEINEFLGEPELEQWSPENSPLRTSEFHSDYNYNEPRRDFGRGYRSEWPRQRNLGRRDHRSGNRRWRDRDRDRDRRRH